MKASVTYIPVAAGPQPPAVPPPASGAQRITDPTLDRITQLTEAPGTSTARTFEYDAQHRLTEIKLNGVRERGYDLNDRNQRIREYSHDTKSYMQYTYDNQGQLTFYGRRETGEFEGGSPSIYFGGYTYDMVGNRLVKMWMGGDDVIYTPNVVNQYSKITEMENSWEPGIETEFAYNPDGCQLSSTGGWSYGWNGENRLISAENGDTRLEFNYDYMGRRFEKKVYSANVLTKHEKFVYDGYKLIQVLDALNDNAVTMTFVWHPESTGLDTPFSMTYNGEIYYYVTDGNKNVTALLDANGNRAAEYIYHPFGTIYSKTGPMVDLNPFRFSSEYHDDETGLVYYNYRYYSPELGRWISRDPIEEEGGVNLYAMVGNNPVNKFDRFGFSSFDILYEMFNMSPGAVPPYSPVTKGGCCGKDVTKKLNSLLNNVKKRLSTLNNKLLLTSNPSMFFPGDGWDIWEFYQNDVRLTKGSYGEDCELTVAYNGHCVKMTSLNYVLWGLLASIKDNAFGGPSVSSSFAHLAFATAYAAYKAENNDENEAAATAFWGRVGFSLAGMQFYHTGNIDVWDVLDFTSCKVKPNNEYTGKLTAHIRYGFSSSSFLEIVSD